ncbi:MAG: hypothetical protein ACD_9C00263G0003 [uncultured bacterium]|nr:MAG: hypothetical protein ACD_9C00263G0003 [uncultured bacterium]
MKSETQKIKVAILGGGITGSSIFYTLAKYTNVKSIVLIEKCEEIGQVNSRENNNSQTLHFGDIEANYSFEKAAKTKVASEMVVSYLGTLSENEKEIYKKSFKMLLAVGKKEIKTLEERFLQFKKLFPELKLITADEIEKIEPLIAKGRKKSEKIAACYSDNGYVVDFGKLAKNLTSRACAISPTTNQLFLNTKVIKISKKDQGFLIETNKKTFFAETVVVAMCSHSLMFAKSLGYGKEFSILPVGGNFYTSSRKVLNAKVYTMQSDKLPFAGVHGDPNIHNESETRFGPTANVMPFLERNDLKTFTDFIKSSFYNFSSIKAFAKVLSEKTLFTYLAKSLIYEVPFLGPRTYAKLCQKIIPTLKYEDFKNGKSKAGIRPQLINIETQKLQMGEVEIEGDKILFNITPSPGATACFKNAKESVKKTIRFFDGAYSFDEKSFEKDFSKTN